MSSFYVLGARQKKGAQKLQEWSRYDEAIIAEVEPETGRTEIRLGRRTPADHCPDDDPSFIFKAGSVQRDILYACNLTEVLTYRLPDLTEIGCISIPCFNDLHHVAPNSAGNLLVASTGLDMVIELTRDGDLVREWSALDDDPWSRFSRTVDYRKVPTTKPHYAHPNFVFEIDGEPWTTRFVQRDAVCLLDKRKRIELGLHSTIPLGGESGGPHDGVRFGDFVYFTRVDGFVFVADARSHKVIEVVDLNPIGPRERNLGWCRGIHVVDEKRVIVGFTVIRPTKHRENLQWLKSVVTGGKAGSYPTRIALYDLSRRELVWEHVMQDAGVNAIFSIHPAR
jgi:hypothetical protein